jgi:serine/threonine-protein kinase
VKTRIPTIETDETQNEDLFEQRVFVDKGEIGRGGMGSVRRAWDPRILRATAMKAIDPARARPELVPRFIEEAQITGQLEHPHIVPVHEFGVDDSGQLYMSMKLVQGDTLWHRVHSLGDRRLDGDNLGDLLQVLVKICEAVGYAHSRGVVHRDLKASNIMCGPFGQVYVLDWGIASVLAGTENTVQTSRDASLALDKEDALVGTPAWMAPEQAYAEHERVDGRTDVFAIGALLYFVLTARPPYGARGDVVRTIRLAQVGQFVPPSRVDGVPPVPSQLERIALKAMALNPEDRYQTVGELKAELEHFLRGTWSFPVVHFAANEAVMREGDEGDTAYVVRTGSLRVTKGTGEQCRTLRRLGPGDCFGELAVFQSAPRTATVTAVEDCELLLVTREALSDGLGLNTWMGAFVRALAQRFAEAEDRMRV